MHKLLIIAVLLDGLLQAPVWSEEFLPAVSSRDVPRLLQSTEWLRGLSETDLIRLVPEQSGLRYVGCPNCSGGRQEDQLAWSPKQPDEIYCRYCQHRYPSEKYPMTQVVKVRTPDGAQAQYPYWSDPKGYRYFFQASRDDLVRAYLAQRTEDLALLYRATNDEAVARRAAVLLDRFAEVFPGWCYHFDYPFQQKEIYDGDVTPEQFRPGYRTARWNWWAYSDIPSPLVRAYGLLRDSSVFKHLSIERGLDVAARIEHDLFRATAEQVLANPEPYTNMSPTAWRSLVELGRVIEEPRFVHEPARRIRRLVESQFFYDGAWSEGSPDYASQTLGGLGNVIGLVKGYSDPPGYVDPLDGSRFDDLDLAGSFPSIAQARLALKKLHFPNGRPVPVHDTWSTSKRDSTDATEAYLLPALGHACLGGGTGDEQTQFHLTWSGGYGHAHADNLSLLLFSSGHELLSDLGYTHTAYRSWTLSTAAHNTVVIDGQSQAFGGRNMPSDGSLRFFDARGQRVQVASADGTRGYPGLATTYRRTVIVVDAGENRRYAVDCFKVAGGNTHDYFLHGDADEKATLTTELELQPMSSLLPTDFDWQATRNEGEASRAEEPHYAYGFLRELHATSLRAGTTAEITFQGANSKGPSLRVSMLPEVGSQLITGVNPSIRQAGEDDAKLDQFHRPFMVLRHQPSDGQSTFVSVMEPYQETPWLTSVERIALPGGAVGVRIEIGARTDIVVLDAQSKVSLPAGSQPVTFQGDYGVISLRGERVEHAYAVGQGGWTHGEFHLAATGPRSSPLLRTEEQTLVVSGATPPDLAVPEAGDIIRVLTSDGWVYPYTLVATEARGEELRLTVAEGPGFQFDPLKQSLQFDSFPQREHSGAVHVEWNTRSEH